MVKIDEIINTWGYVNDNVISVVPDKTWDPCIKIIIPSTYIINRKIPILLCFGPKLVVLM